MLNIIEDYCNKNKNASQSIELYFKHLWYRNLYISKLSNIKLSLASLSTANEKIGLHVLNINDMVTISNKLFGQCVKK